MRPLARRAVAAGVALVAAVALAACSSDSPPATHTIGILRAAPGSPTEGQLFVSLAAGGFPRGRLRVLGGGADEVHAAPLDALATVTGWKKQGVELIFALSTSGAKAAAAGAPGVPVLFLSTDPKGTGLVRDLRHPEGSLTGSSYRVPSDRTLTVAADALGPLHTVGCLVAADDPAAAPVLDDLMAGAKSLGIEVRCATFHGAIDAPAAAQQVVTAGVDAIVLVNSPTLTRVMPQLAPTLSTASVPVISNSPVDLAVLTLEPDGADVYRQMGRQAVRLLEGTPVAKVPVQDPGHYLLVVNEAIATRLGRTIPEDVLRRADRVVR